MKYDFDKLINRRGTSSIKWNYVDFLKKLGYDVENDNETISLFVADMDFPIAMPIINSLKKRLDYHCFGYVLNGKTYYDAVRGWMKKRFDWEIENKHIIPTRGTLQGIKLAISAFSKIGDGVLIQTPVYGNYSSIISETERNIVNNPLKKDKRGHYIIDFEDFKTKVKDDKTKIFLLCSPHNPVGKIFTNEELKKMAKICKENNVIVVADEIHCDLTRNNEEFVPIARAAQQHDNIVVCNGISKTFSLPKLSAANTIIIDDNLRQAYQKLRGIPYSNPLTETAVIAAYNEGEEWLDQVREYLDETFVWIENFLIEKMPKVKFIKPQATYFCWLDFSEYELSEDEVFHTILTKAKVIPAPGSLYGKGGQCCIRLCIPSSRSVIKEAFERIYRVFENDNKTISLNEIIEKRYK